MHERRRSVARIPYLVKHGTSKTAGGYRESILELSRDDWKDTPSRESSWTTSTLCDFPVRISCFRRRSRGLSVGDSGSAYRLAR